MGADSLTYFAADPRIVSVHQSSARIRRHRSGDHGADPPPRSAGLSDPGARRHHGRLRNVAEANPQVEHAVATLRWTGSWYTVFIAAEPQSRRQLTQRLCKSAANERRPLSAGRPGHSAGSRRTMSRSKSSSPSASIPTTSSADVKQSLLQVLGSGMLPRRPAGYFHPDNFTFGQTVYLSPIYAAARTVAGVQSVTAHYIPAAGRAHYDLPATGEIPLGPFQVARLDNDPSLPDHGQLTLAMQGGK